MAKINRTAAVWREPAQVARLEEYHRLHPERKGKAPLVGFVQASGDRPGIGIDSEGKEIEFAEKPPDSDFITPKPGTPEGQFIEDPATGEKIPLNTAQERRQSIYQSAGGIRDRKNERIMAAKLFARQESKKQIDGKTTEFGYTPQQQRKLDAIQASRAKLEFEMTEAGGSRWTPDQMHRMEVQLSQSEGMILPQRVRRQPTVQDQFNANIVTLPNGSKALFNPAKGTTEPLDVGTKIPYKDWTKGIADTTEAMTTFNDVTGKEIVPDPAEVQRVFMDNYRAYQEAQGIVGGAAGEPQQPDLLAERKAGFAGTDIKGRLQAIRQQAIAEGKSEAEADEIVNRLSGGQAVTPQRKGRTSGDKLFENLPEAKQKKLLEAFRKKERKRQKPQRLPAGSSGLTFEARSRFKPMSEEQFIERYNTDREFRRKTRVHERVEGALPETWEVATNSERQAMFREFQKTERPGARQKSFFDFGRLMEDNPDRIAEFLKK